MRWLTLLLFAAVLSLAAPAGAQPAQQQVDKGLAEFQDLEFAAAIETLEAMLKGSGANESQSLLALELIAISHLSLGQTQRGRDAFRRLLLLRSDYTLRNHEGSPKVQSVFDSVRASLLPSGPTLEDTSLRLREPKSVRAGKRMRIIVESRGRRPSEVMLTWRVVGEARGQKLPLRFGKGRWSARLRTPRSTEDYQLLYYVQAKGPAGEVLASIGSEFDPAAIPIRGQRQGKKAGSGNWYTSWPFFLGLGVAAVAGTSVALLASGSDLQEGALSPGRITLSP